MGRPRKVQATEPVEQAAPLLQLTPEEIQAIMSVREQIASGAGTAEPVETGYTEDSGSASKPAVEPQIGISELAQALITAIEATRPTEKKTINNRRKRNPWTPKDGSPKILAFKRLMYHHGIPIDPKTTFNEDCLLLDKIRPGRYCNGIVTVTKRKDNGLDIDYPIRTAAQRLRLVNQFSITSFNALLVRILAERADPKKYALPEDLDD